MINFRHKTLLISWLIILAAAYTFKLLAPSSGHIGINQTHWSTKETFDQSASLSAIKNYRNEGLFCHNGLQNRTGQFTQSVFSVPCLGQKSSKIEVLNLEGNNSIGSSWMDECIYSKTPPLYFWMMAKIRDLSQTLQSVRWVACLLQLVWGALIYFFLSAVWQKKAALFATLIFTFTHSFWSWGYYLYSYTFSLLFITLVYALIHWRFAWRYFFIFIASFISSFSLLETVPMLNLYPWVFAGLERRRENFYAALSVSAGSVLALIIFAVMRASYFGSWSASWLDLTSAHDRYFLFMNPIMWCGSLIAAFNHLNSETFYPTWAIVLLVIFSIVIEKNKSPSRSHLILVALFIASCGMLVVSPPYAYYHPFIAYHLFSLFLVGIIASALDQTYRSLAAHQASLVVAVLTIGALVYSLPKLVEDSKQTASLFKNSFTPAAKIIDIAWGNDFSSINSRDITQLDIWTKHHDRLRLIDGFYPPEDRGMKLDPAWAGELSIALENDSSIAKVSFLVDTEKIQAFNQYCRLHVWDNVKKWIAVSWNNSSPYDGKGKYKWVEAGENHTTKGLKLACNPQQEIKIYEMKVE